MSAAEYRIQSDRDGTLELLCLREQCPDPFINGDGASALELAEIDRMWRAHLQFVHTGGPIQIEVSTALLAELDRWSSPVAVKIVRDSGPTGYTLVAAKPSAYVVDGRMRDPAEVAAVLHLDA